MKKFISLILCLAMILSFVTVFASAKGYTITVNGSSKDATKAQSGKGWNWNANGTLTLDDYNGDKIVISAGDSVKIVFKGKNTIKSSDAGIQTNGKLEISGMGTLTINADGIGIEAKDLKLSSGIVNINSKTAYAISVFDNASDNIRSGLVVNGAKVTATAKTHEAVWVDGNITVSDGKLAAKTSATRPAIVAFAMTESHMSGSSLVWDDKDFGDYGVTVGKGASITPKKLQFAKVVGDNGEAYSEEAYNDDAYNDDAYTSDIYDDTDSTGAKWDRTQYYKMVASSTVDELKLNGNKMTYSTGYSNDVVIEFPNKLFGTNNIIRTYGDGRLQTAIAAAEALKKVKGVSKFDNIVIAAGANEKFPDALSGSYLAAVKNAPILLALPDGNDDVVKYISKNFTGKGKVYILGGTSSVTSKFEKELKSKLGSNGSKIKRLAGDDRYITNIKILKEAGFVGNSLVVCTGISFPDALSSSALGMPILLVDNNRGGLTSDQRSYLGQSAIKSAVKNIYVIGGPNSVKTAFESTIGSYFTGETITRFSGADRYATAKAVADKFFKGTETITIATGTGPADALAAGPVAYAMNAPVLLVAPDTSANKANATKFASSNMSGKYMMIFGGTASVSDSVAKNIISGKIVLNHYPSLGK